MEDEWERGDTVRCDEEWSDATAGGGGGGGGGGTIYAPRTHEAALDASLAEVQASAPAENFRRWAGSLSTSGASIYSAEEWSDATAGGGGGGGGGTIYSPRTHEAALDASLAEVQASTTISSPPLNPPQRDRVGRFLVSQPYCGLSQQFR
eukprot:SAG22_NODE_970_length_6231_cov_2.345890_3_plen_150_part_00